MDRLERLINLVAALLAAERPLSREDLRVRVGGYADDDDAFRRNFERDKDVLRQMGMPLEVEPLDPSRSDVEDGYRIAREHYELVDPELTDDELAALRLAASAVALEGGEDAATTALRKLAGVPGSGSVLPGRPGGGDAGPLAEVPSGEAVGVLFGAVAERRQMRFGYRGAVRILDPWRLSFRNGQWYVLGLDHGRGESRLFRVDRIEGVPEATSGPGAFTKPPGAAVSLPPAWQLGDEDDLVATLLVDASQAGFAEDAAGADAVRDRRPDGSVVLELQVTNRAGFRSFALGFLDHAEVIGPPELRDDVTRWLEAIADPAGP